MVLLEQVKFSNKSQFKIFYLVDLKQKNIIDEIVLEFEKDEFIYCIKGYYYKDKIRRFAIHTTSGRFAEFGCEIKKFNFQWDYHYNLRIFDGFIIGWNNSNINYLANIYVKKQI